MTKKDEREKVFARLNSEASVEFELIKKEFNLNQTSEVIHFIIRDVANRLKKKSSKQKA